MKNLVNLAYMNDVLNLKFCMKSKEMPQKEKRERERELQKTLVKDAKKCRNVTNMFV